jgi:S-adenosylmethionine hydrolase
MKSTIALLTDFGDSPFPGIIKGVIAKINPRADIIDLTHHISPYNIGEAFLILSSACLYFPCGTIFLTVVDPGVGGKRKPIAVETQNYFWVGPDNGLASGLLNQDKLKLAVHLDRQEYWLTPVSQTFHGRDIFAPVSAWLSLGVPLTTLGSSLKRIKTIKQPEPKVYSHRIRGEIIYIDSFGNLVTNIKILPLNCQHIKYKNHKIAIKSAYSRVKPGELLALGGSFGYLEIAVREGSAAAMLDARVGEAVEVGCQKSEVGI